MLEKINLSIWLLEEINMEKEEMINNKAKSKNHFISKHLSPIFHKQITK